MVGVYHTIEMTVWYNKNGYQEYYLGTMILSKKYCFHFKKTVKSTPSIWKLAMASPSVKDLVNIIFQFNVTIILCAWMKSWCQNLSANTPYPYCDTASYSSMSCTINTYHVWKPHQVWIWSFEPCTLAMSKLSMSIVDHWLVASN